MTSETAARLKSWSRQIGEFALGQGFGQAAGMLSGLIFAQAMPIYDYAFFALCMTTLAMISVGSDLGLTGSLSYFWRNGLKENAPIGAKIVLVHMWRDRLLAVATVIGAGLLIGAASGIEQSMAQVAVGLLAVAIHSWLQAHAGIDIQLLRLEGRQRETYLAEAAGSATRLLIAVTMLIAGAVTAWGALSAGIAGAAATYGLASQSRRDRNEERVRPTEQDFKELRAYLLLTIPPTVVYLLRDPLVMYMTATRAGTVTVAEVFALSRISMIFALLGSFVIVVLVPRLAGVIDDRRFMRLLIASLIAVAGICAVVVGVIGLAPDWPLLLIGSNYAHLTSEVTLAALTASLGVLTSLAALSARLRGWVALDPHFSVVMLAVVIVLCAVWTFRSTRDVIELNLLLATISLFQAIGTVALGHFRSSIVSVGSVSTVVATKQDSVN